MTAALLISVAGLTLALIAPGPLNAMLRRSDPHITLLTWATLVVATVTALLAPLVLSLAPGHGGMAALTELAHRCLLAPHDTMPARLESAIGIVGVLMATITVVRFLIHWRATARQRIAVHDKHISLFRILHGHDSEPVLWLPLPTPVAYSIAGRPAMIVASNGLRNELDDEALNAVLAHERAHIRRHHHFLVELAEAAAYAVPWLPLTRRSPELVRALVELDADSHAAHRHGSAPVHRALTQLRGHATPATTLAIAQDCVELRLARLADDHAQAQHAPRRTRAAIWTAAVTAPILPLVMLGAGVALSTCGG
ncbi:M56 family metallopeptidase [Nocardia sp. NBC_01388]|uniref:M56 family metallopeptidase n=1 Tax=Nocardia sp. NBC_01388 TaxID=2903596 RepID=UPI00324DC8FE